MTPKITPMNVGGVRHLVDRAYRESGDQQYLRELYVNALEAGATRVVFGPEWCGVETLGVYRLMVADDGDGMAPEDLLKFLNTFGGGGKPIGDAHENYGVGAKTSLLPWNSAGVVVLSWTDATPEGAMVWLMQDPTSGEYGARKIPSADGTFEEVVIPGEIDGFDWANVKPGWVAGHGTVVVALGSTGKEDTFLGKPGTDDNRVKAISTYLNKRFWEIPQGVEVVVQELRSQKRDTWPRSLEEAQGPQPTGGEPDRRYNSRTVLGAKHHVVDVTSSEGHAGPSGELELEDGTAVRWFLWTGVRPHVDSYAHRNGFVAALYKNELFDTQTHPSNFRSFGITQKAVRDNLTLVVVPPPSDGAYGVYPDTARNALKIQGTRKAGEPLPWSDWAQEFAERLPAPIREALAKAGPTNRGSLDDPSWRARLNDRFGDRWKSLRHVADPNGTVQVLPVATAPPPSLPATNSSSSSSGGATSPRPARAAGPTPNAAPAHGGGTQARAVRRPAGVPKFDWVTMSDVGESGYAAVWNPPSATEPAGLVQIARDYPAIVEVKQYWFAQYPDHLADKIGAVIEEVYGHALVARIAHSERLVSDAGWGRSRVEQELRSPAALTMALLGLYSEDHLLASKIGAIGVRRKAV